VFTLIGAVEGGRIRCVETGTTTIVHNMADISFFLTELLTAVTTDESTMSHSFYYVNWTAVCKVKEKLLIDGLQRFMSNVSAKTRRPKCCLAFQLTLLE